MISKGKLFFSWAISTSAGHSWEVYQHACKTRVEIKYHIQLCWFQPHSLIYGVKYLTAHEGNLRTVLTVTTLNIILPFLEDWKPSVRLCLTILSTMNQFMSLRHLPIAVEAELVPSLSQIIQSLQIKIMYMRCYCLKCQFPNVWRSDVRLNSLRSNHFFVVWRINASLHKI